MADRGWWMVHRTVRPLAARPFITSTTFLAWKESRPEVGSSRKSRLGVPTISTPMEHRRLSPPETPRGKPPGRPHSVSAASLRPSSSMRLATVATLSASGTPGGWRRRAWSSRVSRTVRNGTSCSSCMTYAAMERKAGVRGAPPARTSPVQWPPAGRRPQSAFSRLVLPEPVGPMTARTWPGRAAPEMSRSTTLGASPLRLPAIS
mmetsp:Transcript_9216/g.32021  ORF Transcript_9216/g.32021 Transcript_9216/m.32021 type:complete len:205 (-) Transcript_9216:267-881(-)